MYHRNISLVSNNYRYNLRVCTCCIEAQKGKVKNFEKNIFKKNGVLFEDVLGLTKSMAIEESSKFKYGDEYSDKGDDISVAYFDNELVYEGPIVDDKLNGHGKLTIDGNIYYEGDFKDNQFHGEGKLHSFYGDLYEGQFFEGSAQGTGKVQWQGGNSYEGLFKENLIDGWGTYNFASGSYYEGNHKEGMRDGSGTLTLKYPNVEYKLSSYHWRFDYIQGEGHISDSIKPYTYVGGIRTCFKFSQPGVFYFIPHGNAFIMDEDKSEIFSGEYKNGARNGKGKAYYSNGNRKFFGTFVDNKYQGKGIYYNENGNVLYEGDFNKHQLHGKGWFYHYDDNQKEISKEFASFKSGRRHGKSSRTDCDLKTKVEYYFHGKVVNSNSFGNLNDEKKENISCDNCPICQNRFQDCKQKITELSCGHTFHTNCLFDWLDKKESCPICREEDIFRVPDEEPEPEAKRRKV